MSRPAPFCVRRNRPFLDWAGNPFRLPIIGSILFHYYKATIAFAS
jgi:hypothetical protein